MNNSVWDESLYIEEESEDEENESNCEEEGNDSDSSSYSNDNNRSKPNSLNVSWPQSYRQSIDLYSNVQSPNLNFLGTPTLSQLGSSFFSSPVSRRHTPEILPSLAKPLIPPPTTTVADEQQPQQRRSSQSLLPPTPSRKSSIIKKVASDQKYSSKISDELRSISGQSSFGQAVINGINVLCGVGILSTPYAVREGGWYGLSILFIFAMLSFYTGILLRHCLDSQPGLDTYPDIGQAAFGTAGRILISIILYVELYKVTLHREIETIPSKYNKWAPPAPIYWVSTICTAACVEYIILEGDNLSSLFPNAHLSLGGLELNSELLFAVMATLAVLPTVWLRDLSVLSYISAGGVIASVLVAICLFWVGLVNQVGTYTKGTTLNFSSLPVAIGLYGYCYSGHAVFPNIYTSMAKRSQFPLVLLTSFGICTLLYAGVAVMGYKMFGELTESQFTLNLPHDLVASKIAVWATVVNPFTKYALTISPVAMSLEELIPSSHYKSRIYSILIRTILVISTLVVGRTIPFFGLVMALIGSLLSMLVTLILPCACFLSILRNKVTRFEELLCKLVIIVGVLSLAFGTYSSLSQIIEQFC